MEIKILGTGCPKCRTLDRITREVVKNNGIDAHITKVENIMEILKYNILSTPALVIDEKVVLSGHLPTHEELKKLLTA